MKWGDTDSWKKPEPRPAQPLPDYLKDLLAYAEKTGASVVSVPVERLREMEALLKPKVTVEPTVDMTDSLPKPGAWYVPMGKP